MAFLSPWQEAFIAPTRLNLRVLELPLRTDVFCTGMIDAVHRASHFSLPGFNSLPKCETRAPHTTYRTPTYYSDLTAMARIQWRTS